MKIAKSLKELQMAFLGWKQCKKVFAVYFDKNIARELVKILNTEPLKKPCHWCGAVGDEEHGCGDPEIKDVDKGAK